MKMCREHSRPHGVSTLQFSADDQLLAGTVQGRLTLLQQSPACSLSVDKSTLWNLGQVPHSQDYVVCLGSGAVAVLQLTDSTTAPQLLKVGSQQLSEAPITG